MSAADALLYIDANKYLDLYRTVSGKKLLGPLSEQAKHIFVNQQTVNEVQRNKVLVAASFLAEKFKTLKLQTFNVPDHLSGTSEVQARQILQDMSEIVEKIARINSDIDAHAIGILELISRSEDAVSASLQPIFANAIRHSEEELRRARERRELGNPPGKITNAIGDQLTWEQILSNFKGKKRLWIISRDGDYGTVHGGKRFVNRLLLDELRSVAPDADAFLFTDMVEGITHFVNTTGVKAEKRLTPEEVVEVELEEQSLPPVFGTSPTSAALDVHRSIEEAMKSIQPSLDVRRSIAEAMKSIQPSLDVRRSIEEAMKSVQPSFDVRRSIEAAMKSIQPSRKPDEIDDVQAENAKNNESDEDQSTSHDKTKD